ncbi:hypothetical protein IFM89_021140 [Coptis chinensis]|uniref:Uncharacterized protein n=1 Tax=Coptis chinensis TaxID=261450 RepID=A0A835I4X3_9MAGN|nr:hypothetical protein IFM89_021140 [Coptis chinensis]
MEEFSYFRKSRSYSGYRQLAVQSSTELLELNPKKLRSLKETTSSSNTVQGKEAKKVTTSHPIFNMADARRSKKAMKKPDFMRYMAYVKEGGTWNSDSNSPAIYFK